MTVDTKSASSWPNGSNNLTPRGRVPEGFVRHAVNMEPTPGGTLDLRCGQRKVYSGTEVRACFAVDDDVAILDGAALLIYSQATDSATQVATVASVGPAAGAVFNSQLYLRTTADSLRYANGHLKPWAIEAPLFTVSVTTGALPAGIYKVAVTALGVDGEESGCQPAIINLPANSALRVTSGDPRKLLYYCTAVNGESMYCQGQLYATAPITTVDDRGATLTTADMFPMPAVTQLVEYHGVIVGCSEDVVWYTDPMRPHLINPEQGFYQFSEKVTMIAATDGGVYVAADRTYFLTGLETDSPSRREVANHGAVGGTAVKLPDGSAAWFTRYGLAIGSTSGQIDLKNRTTYAPDTAAIGAAGVLEHNGNQLVVTTMRGATKANRLAAGDFCEVEITDERTSV